MINKTGTDLILMSAEHGTSRVKDGEEFPEWYAEASATPSTEPPAESAIKDRWLAYVAVLDPERDLAGLTKAELISISKEQQ